MTALVEWYNGRPLPHARSIFLTQNLVACKYYLIGPALFFAPYFFVDAPFGRFSPSKSSRLLVDGMWVFGLSIFLELIPS